MRVAVEAVHKNDVNKRRVGGFVNQRQSELLDARGQVHRWELVSEHESEGKARRK
jgi:hypothetical protein